MDRLAFAAHFDAMFQERITMMPAAMPSDIHKIGFPTHDTRDTMPDGITQRAVGFGRFDPLIPGVTAGGPTTT
jgi:hypothetical protein